MFPGGLRILGFDPAGLYVHGRRLDGVLVHGPGGQGAIVRRMFGHAVYRAIVLVMLGVFLYSNGRNQTNFVFKNVLAQIGLGYIFVSALESPAVAASDRRCSDFNWLLAALRTLSVGGG